MNAQLDGRAGQTPEGSSNPPRTAGAPIREAHAHPTRQRSVVRGLVLGAIGLKLVSMSIWWIGSLVGQAEPSVARAASPAEVPGKAKGEPRSEAKSESKDARANAGATGDMPAVMAKAGSLSPSKIASSAAVGELKSLLDAASRRQVDLDAREQELSRREEQLKLFEKDVSVKIATLEELEKKLTVQAKAAKTTGDAAADSLAKIYGAMKASESAPLLEQLDPGTLLRIVTRMKEKQVGEILPLMSREQALVLTRALADRGFPAQ